ncbi:TOG array regulator of axonemal microtubule protein 1 [Taenia crassiceps]|uniref:TOG array regulator of axonemal microtubule protein 1 n=1 Tax=Taenia crassiceps TaxID=6207 RepID=A0ABR4Q502_9CEST
MRSAKVQRDDDEGLLWNHFSTEFESSSFLLSEELFEKINALARGDLAVKLAHDVAADVTQRMETCLQDFVVVVTATEKSGEELLVRTPQVTIVSAITELLVMDSDFTLLLLGLKSFTNLISAITEAKPRRISQRDFDTLLVNQSGDGYCWIFHLATNFLRIALSDSKRLIRTAGFQLVAKLLRLPKGSKSIVRDLAGPILCCHDDNVKTLDAVKSRLRKEAVDCVTMALLLSPTSELNFNEIVDSVIVPGLKDHKHTVRSSALDCLAVAVKLDSDALISRVESQLPRLNRNNNAKSEEKKGGQGELSNHQNTVSLRSVVFQRHLPSINSQFRLVRPSRLDSTVEMSTVGQVNYESASSIGERRKPSAGRMHGNLRLPWDPRDSVVVVGSASGPSRSCPLSLPNLSQSENDILGSNFDGSRSSGRSPRRSIDKQNPGKQSLELSSRAEIRRSQNPSRTSYCEDNQAVESRVGVAHGDGGVGSVRIISKSLAIPPSTPDNCIVRNRKLINTIDPPEVSQIRRKASQRRSLQVDTDLELANLHLSDQFDATSPNTYRSFNRFNHGSNPFLLTPPSIPSCLSTSRANLSQHHQGSKFDLSPSCSKKSNSPTDFHNSHSGPLRGQHELAKNMMLSSPNYDFQYPCVDVVGRSMHPVGECRRASIKHDGHETDGRSDNGEDCVSTNKSERKGAPSAPPERDDDEDTLRAGVEGHASRGFGRRSVRSGPTDYMKCASSRRGRKGDLEDPESTGSGPQTHSRTGSLQRPPHGLPTRRPPSIPRDGSIHRKTVRQQSSDSASKEVGLARLSQNHPSTIDSGKCRDVASALNRIASTEWEDKVDGLLSLSALALRHPTAFADSHDTHSAVIHAVTSECRNLRSQVSRQAVKTIADLFRGLGRLLDAHVDTCVRVLLVKTGEASAAFLRGEVAIALSDLVRSVNPNRALVALFQHGLGHKNAAVRRQCAIQASYLIESLGPSRVLQTANQRGNLSSWGSMSTVCSGAGSTQNVSAPVTAITSASSQAITERVIVALGKFLLDSNQETRYYGRRILATLQQSPDFERILTRHLSGQMLRAVHEATDYLHTKGLGEPPTSVASAICPRTVAASEQTDASLQNRGCSAGGLGGL